MFSQIPFKFIYSRLLLRNLVGPVLTLRFPIPRSRLNTFFFSSLFKKIKNKNSFCLQNCCLQFDFPWKKWRNLPWISLSCLGLDVVPATNIFCCCSNRFSRQILFIFNSSIEARQQHLNCCRKKRRGIRKTSFIVNKLIKFYCHLNGSSGISFVRYFALVIEMFIYSHIFWQLMEARSIELVNNVLLLKLNHFYINETARTRFFPTNDYFQPPWLVQIVSIKLLL